MRWPRLPWRRRPDADFRAEVEAHLALEAEALVARGLTPDAARHQARRSFGNLAAHGEAFHDARRWLWVERLGRNTRYALRSLRRHPAFTAVAVATLAFGVGLNTAVFSLLYAAVLRPLPVPHADRVVNVYRDLRGVDRREVSGSTYDVSYAEFLAYRAGNHTFVSLAAYRDEEVSVGLADPMDANAELASCEYFTTLNVRVALGRALLPADCAFIGSGPVAVLSDALWHRAFGADPSVLGRLLRVNQLPTTIVGVAPPGFEGITLQPAALWLPITYHPALLHGQDSLIVHDNASWLQVVGRLRPGVSRRAGLADLSVVATQYDAAHRGAGARSTVLVLPGAYENDPIIFTEGSPVFIGAAALLLVVLLLSCANVMNLLLARAAARQREISIRLSLGASRRQLVAQLMTESLILAACGGAAGLLVARWAPRVGLAAAPAAGLRMDFGLDWRILGYAALASLVAALLFGLAPALHATRLDLSRAMRVEGGGLSRSTGASRARAAIVSVQLAGSGLLLVLAALFAHSLAYARDVDPGYPTERLLAVSLDLQKLGYDSTRAAQIMRSVEERLRAQPGVQSVGLVRRVPLAFGRSTMGLTPDQVDPGVQSNGISVDVNTVSRDYFATLNVPVLRGRVAGDAEPRSPAMRPVVVNEALARRFWPTSDAVGKTLHSKKITYYITGVAKDVHNVSLGRTDAAYVYQIANPADPSGLSIVVRVAGALDPLERAVPPLVRTVDPNLVVSTQSLAAVKAQALRPTQTGALLAAIMGLVAALLALVGVYGVVSYSVVQQTREIGIRLALGASRFAVVRLVLGGGMPIVAAGVGVGLLAAWIASLGLRAVLYGAGMLDWAAFTGAGALLAVAALAAMYGPARRAARLDPAVTLRAD